MRTYRHMIKRNNKLFMSRTQRESADRRRIASMIAEQSENAKKEEDKASE